MKRNTKKTSVRRIPTQNRALVTVESMLDAAIKLLKRGGVSSITTNQIAETAGVSIGSVSSTFRINSQSSSRSMTAMLARSTA